MSRMRKRITAVTLTFALTLTSVCGGIRIQGVTPEVKTAKAAESEGGAFVKDIVISYASSKKKAEQELGPDYIVLDKNFNDGMSGNSWIGYTTTDDEDEAITDIKAMPMDGKYSTSDYEVLLKNQKHVIEIQLDAVIPAIIEFAKNYDAGLTTAQTVYSLLNVYHEDDSDKNMGDFLLEKGRALAKNRKDSKSISDLEKIYMEGNNYVVSSIETLLVHAQDTQLKKTGSWLTRMSMVGPNGLYDIYKKAVGGNKNSINRKLDEEFSETADTILKGLSTVREAIREGENSEIAKADGDEAATLSVTSELSGDDIEEVPYNADVDELMESMYEQAENGANAAESMTDMTAYSLSKLLKETPYGKGKTMYDLFMDEHLSKRDLYPMVYALSNGQKSILETMGVYPLFESVFAEYSEKDGEEPDDVGLDENMFSVYEGVDRSIFDGDTAITAETLKNMETKQFRDFLPVEDYTTVSVCSVIIAAVAIGATIRSFTWQTKILGGEGYEYYEKSILDTMKKNLTKMNSYENAWKLKYMEQKGFITQSLDNVASQQAINEMYQKSIDEIGMRGSSGKKIMSEINRLGERDKTRFLSKYQTLIDEQTNKISRLGEGQKFRIPRAGWGTRIACSIGAVAAIAFAGYEIYCMINHDKINFAHIPSNMVARTYEGDVEYLAYHAVTTKSGKAADIHDKKGKGWQVLYTTSDHRMGDPILASSLWITGGNASSDPEMVPVTYFDESYAADLADDEYTGAETDRASMFFKRGTEPDEEVAEVDETEEPEETEEPISVSASGSAADLEGSVFGGSTLIWIIILLVLVVGVGAGTGVYIRKRKK